MRRQNGGIKLSARRTRGADFHPIPFSRGLPVPFDSAGGGDIAVAGNRGLRDARIEREKLPRARSSVRI